MKHLRSIVTGFLLLLLGVAFVPGTTSAQSCCVVRGDANHSGAGPDIADLVYLVTYMFQSGPAPECMEEVDINGSGEGPDIADLVYLVTYMFQGGPAPAECPAPSNVVFTDQYGSGVTYEAFGGSLLAAVQIDGTVSQVGDSSLIVTVPDVGDPNGSYSGGAFTDSTARDLTGFNAITFWAKADVEATLDVAGIGNDNTGTSKFTAQVGGLALTTSWQQYVIPFPLAEKLDAERGLFFFAEGPESETGYQFWFDEIVFDSLTTITNPRPSLPAQTVEAVVDDIISINNGTVIFDVDGTDITVSAMAGYFTFESSDEGVVSVAGDGTITATGQGSATLTATLGATAATGSITVNVSGPQPEPTTPAPTPTIPQDSVVALYSGAYIDHPVDTWSASWDDADVEDFVIGTDSTKKYTNLVFAGIEFTTTTLDASAMSHFHMDVWTPDAISGAQVFKVKLVSFGGDGAWGGGDDTEFELSFDENTVSAETWVGIDVPLSAFSGLAETAHMAQLVISGDPNTVYVDNIYFYDAGLSTEPEVSAPTPTEAPGNVVSLFSDAYTNHPVDTWSAVWDDADVADFTIGSDNIKQYTNLTFAGIEFTTTTLDASAMTRFHMDVWTPDVTDNPANLRVKLVDFGGDGAWGGGDDTEHELVFDETTMNTYEWVGIDVALSDFAGLGGTGHLAQLIVSSDSLNTVFLDNIYFYVPGATEPSVAAPTPTVPSDSVVSLYSGVYTNHPVDTWSAGWDDADVEDFVVAGDSTKKYTNLTFAGIEFTTTTLDASAMNRFHMDVWTPDGTANPSNLRVKLVDFGGDGAWGGGDDVEHELIFDETTMNTAEWVGIDVALSDFTGLTTTGHLAQMIVSSDSLSTVFVDNIYFYQAAPTEPAAPATTPDYDAGSVISLFSDAYSDVAVDTWSTGWDDADVADVTIASDNVKLYTNLTFAGIEFTTTTIDASSMTRFHMDVWTPDGTANPSNLRVKLVDFGGDGAWGGGDDVEHELIFDETTMNTGEWVAIDVPLTDFAGLTTTGHLAQLIVSSDSLNTLYVDNIYLYSTVPLAAATTPTLPSDSVISLYSDAYTDHPVDTWSAGWDAADVADVTIGSDNAKLYTNLSFAGVEFTTTTVDASTMTHFHLDVWTADPTGSPAVFKVKLVSFGGDGAWGGGDDTEHELTFDETTMNSGGWVGLEIPMTDFAGLGEVAHLAQLVISGDPNTVYVDNVYFHK